MFHPSTLFVHHLKLTGGPLWVVFYPRVTPKLGGKVVAKNHRDTMHECALSRSVLSGSLRPHGLQHTRLLCPGDSPGKKTGVGCCFLQGIFPAQGLNSRLLHWQADSLRLSHLGTTGSVNLSQEWSYEEPGPREISEEELQSRGLHLQKQRTLEIAIIHYQQQQQITKSNSKCLECEVC